jgi:Alw26I/Eco31I/Esp3I family type II restriction m6 adenine DNA methyltransferase
LNHLAILEHTAYLGAKYAAKTLVERATGAFYTPKQISKYLIRNLCTRMITRASARISVIDPFAGDGRLVADLVEECASRGLKPQWIISLWDINPEDLCVARAKLVALRNRLHLSLKIQITCGDSFCLAAGIQDTFDVVITNPPWEVLKPDRRELRVLSTPDRETYTHDLRQFDERLAKQFPLSQPTRKFAGWGTSLSRVGTELSIRLAKRQGLVAIVTPASLFADQISFPLRAWMFSEFSVVDVGHFPAEAKLFKGVDQPAVAFVGSRAPSRRGSVRISSFDSSGEALIAQIWSLSHRNLMEKDYCVPFGASKASVEMFSRMNSLSTWGSLEATDSSFWAGRELDETGRDRYLGTSGNYPFVKGRMIGRFAVLETPTFFVREDVVKIPTTASVQRIVWRDVTRPNQKRRMQATILEPGMVSGNSLNVACFRKKSPAKLKALLGVINSVAFEAQIRSRLMTAHVSLGSVRTARLPDLNSIPTISRLSDLVSSCLRGTRDAESALEVEVAKAYGMKREDFEIILTEFPKLDHFDRGVLLNHKMWKTHRSISRGKS